MNASRRPSAWSRFTDEIRRAFREYLAMPSLIVLGFIALGSGLAWLATSEVAWFDALQRVLRVNFVGDQAASRAALGVLAGGLITITSLTFTVLLIAVQQAANSMSTMILDQFLGRSVNQFTFGYFVGASVFALFALATAASGREAALAVLLTFVFTALALYFLAVLVYVTLTQVRPSIVLNAIHSGTIEARERQLRLIGRMRRVPRVEGRVRIPVRARGQGYLIGLHPKLLERALAGQAVELVLHVQIGAYIALGDEIAELRALDPIDADEAIPKVLRALELGNTRDLSLDPLHGIEQITTIGWTTISTARQSPSGGREAINALRSLLAEWSDEQRQRYLDGDELPVVYHDDVVLQVVGALESLAIVTVKPHQHQNLAQILRVFSIMLGRVPEDLRERMQQAVLRVLTLLEQQTWSEPLDRASSELAEALDAVGSAEIAVAVRRTARETARAQTAEMQEAGYGERPVSSR